MAVKDDVAGLFEQEWARFWQGWEALSPEAQEQEAARRARLRSPGGLPNTVSLPGWDEVIHLTPRTPVTDADRREYYSAQRARRPADLSVDTATEIERRRARARQMASSSSPAYSAAFGQMLTALDNVQDFTTTVATLGRVALWPAIRTLEAITPRFAAIEASSCWSGTSSSPVTPSAIFWRIAVSRSDAALSA